jgi:hypothetical protein
MRGWLVLLLALTGCAAPGVTQFAGTMPAFDPMAFFTGHVRSWGVIENRSGEPTGVITTDCVGTVEAGVLHMVQSLTEGGGTRIREWQLRRTADGAYEATASDIVGVARGEASGRVFHWRYTLALSPGNALKDVGFDQWMYGMADGSMVNRAVLSKLGVTVAEVTEHFVKGS